MKFLIVDDHALIREALRGVLLATAATCIRRISVLRDQIPCLVGLASAGSRSSFSETSASTKSTSSRGPSTRVPSASTEPVKYMPRNR